MQELYYVYYKTTRREPPYSPPLRLLDALRAEGVEINTPIGGIGRPELSVFMEKEKLDVIQKLEDVLEVELDEQDPWEQLWGRPDMRGDFSGSKPL